MTEVSASAPVVVERPPRLAPFLVRLPEELVDDLAEVAVLDRTSRAAVVRRAVRAYIAGRLAR